MKVEAPILVIDAAGSVLGRVASYAAKQASLGKKVIVVNCSQAIISGKRRNIINEYKLSRQRGGSSLNGPHFPSIPFRVMKRTVRGMLNYSHGKGREAFKRVICYNDVPKEFESQMKHLHKKELVTTSIKLSELHKEL